MFFFFFFFGGGGGRLGLEKDAAFSKVCGVAGVRRCQKYCGMREW